MENGKKDIEIEKLKFVDECQAKLAKEIHPDFVYDLSLGVHGAALYKLKELNVPSEIVEALDIAMNAQMIMRWMEKKEVKDSVTSGLVEDMILLSGYLYKLGDPKKVNFGIY